MSENKEPTSEKTETKESVEVIAPDKIVNIQVSGAFYIRLQNLIIYLSSKKDIKEFSAVMLELTKREAKDEYEFNLVTVLMLLNEIEVQAREQKLTEYKTREDLLSKVKPK